MSYTIVWRLDRTGMEVLVDGKMIYTETKTYEGLGEGPVVIGSAFDSTIVLQALSVVPWSRRGK